MITDSNETFDALASEERALRRDLPDLARPSSARRALTFERLDEFQANTRPLVQDLIPVARDISPTLRSVRAALAEPEQPLHRPRRAEQGRRRRACPRWRRILERLRAGARPASTRSWRTSNPIVRYLDVLPLHRHRLPRRPAGRPRRHAALRQPGQPSPRHALRQLSYLSAESARDPPERGSRRTAATATCSPTVARQRPRRRSGGIFPNFDCKNLDYRRSGAEPATRIRPTGDEPGAGLPPVSVAFAPCIIKANYPAEFGEPARAQPRSPIQ